MRRPSPVSRLPARRRACFDCWVRSARCPRCGLSEALEGGAVSAVPVVPIPDPRPAALAHCLRSPLLVLPADPRVRGLRVRVNVPCAHALNAHQSSLLPPTTPPVIDRLPPPGLRYTAAHLHDTVAPATKHHCSVAHFLRLT
jgi:hypothetical protein